VNCRFFQFLYRLLPLTPWQALLVRIHLGKCPECSWEFEPDRDMRDLLITPEALLGTKMDLWNNIRSTLRAQSVRSKAYLRRSWLNFAALISILAVLIVLLLFFVYYLLQTGK